MFIGYANSLDLDIEKFRADLNSADMQRIVMADKRQGMRLNVNSTPTYFINGEKIERNPRTFEEFKALVDQHMN
jgi:protein-disulfide isomerase